MQATPATANPPLVDSHCHLDLAQFEADRDAVVARAAAAGVRALIVPGIDLAHIAAVLALPARYPGVYAAVGIHPNSSGDFDPAQIETLRALAAAPGVVAIGEIGLDDYWKDVPRAQQEAAFEAQLALAAEVGLPVLIHSRDANEAVAVVLRRWVSGAHFRGSALARRPFAGVLHAFAGDAALAEEAYSWGFVLGLGGPVTFRNAKALHALAATLRLDRLLLETDAPYLTPHPHRGQRNEPAYVALVGAALALLHNQPVAEIAAATTAVAARFYGLGPADLRLGLLAAEGNDTRDIASGGGAGTRSPHRVVNPSPA